MGAHVPVLAQGGHELRRFSGSEHPALAHVPQHVLTRSGFPYNHGGHIFLEDFVRRKDCVEAHGVAGRVDRGGAREEEDFTQTTLGRGYVHDETIFPHDVLRSND